MPNAARKRHTPSYRDEVRAHGRADPIKRARGPDTTGTGGSGLLAPAPALDAQLADQLRQDATLCSHGRLPRAPTPAGYQTRVFVLVGLGALPPFMRRLWHAAGMASLDSTAVQSEECALKCSYTRRTAHCQICRENVRVLIHKSVLLKVEISSKHGLIDKDFFGVGLFLLSLVVSCNAVDNFLVG